MSKEAMKLALEALKQIDEAMPFPVAKLAQSALREALAEQPAQQKAQIVRWNCPCGNKYTFHGFTEAPAQRTWVGLKDEEVDECYYWKDRLWTTDELVRHVEAKLKEKNT